MRDPSYAFDGTVVRRNIGGDTRRKSLSTVGFASARSIPFPSMFADPIISDPRSAKTRTYLEVVQPLASLRPRNDFKRSLGYKLARRTETEIDHGIRRKELSEGFFT